MGNKGRFWFGGHRTIEQQMTGLGQLWERVEGKNVLDIGCAEGVIALECLRRGAVGVCGVDNRADAIAEADRLARKAGLSDRVLFGTADANTYDPRGPFDVILMLAILHKLRKPADSLMRFLTAAAPTALVVLRTRQRDWPVLRDERSGLLPQDIRFCMYDHGFNLVHEDDGPIDNGEPPEWVGIFERVRA